MKKPSKKFQKSASLPFCAVLLAGGRGTRFWPRSRMRTPKQLLNIAGRETMLRETASRLDPVFAMRNIWAVTNVEQAAAVRRELPAVPAAHILTEPVGRNTAAAIGLAAIHLAREHGDALMAVLPSDAFVGDVARYRALMHAALHVAAAPGNLVVLGIPPTRPETGYGYIERAARSRKQAGATAYEVRRFAEKPALPVAKKYVASGKYFWNAGMFFWRVSTFLNCLRQFLPATLDALAELAPAIGTRRYPALLQKIYPRLENISVDYAVMEPATHAQAGESARRRKSAAKSAVDSLSVSVIPAEIGWSDIGSWTAVHELLAEKPDANVSAGSCFALDAGGNYFWSPKKFVAAIGVSNIVLVDTGDALLLCSRERSQDVGKIVKYLEEHNLKNLL